MIKFLSLKELHRPPPQPQGQTSAQSRYLTPNTNAAKRLRAVGPCGYANLTAGIDPTAADNAPDSAVPR